MSTLVMDPQAGVPRSYFWPRLIDERRTRPLYPMEGSNFFGADFIHVWGSHDDPTEVARMSGNLRPDAHMHVQPGMTRDVSFSDRLRPVGSEDLYDIRSQVGEIIDRFRPVIG